MGHFDEIHRLFEEARGLDPAAREELLRGIDDGALREELRALLESEAAMEKAGFLSVRTQSPAEGLPAPGAEFGPFRIVRELGRGGMGAVFLAEEIASGRAVAIKILHPLLWTTEEARRELMHEADMARRVEHPAVVSLLDQVEVEGWTVLVFEYIDGEPLGTEIQRFHRGDRDGRWRTREDAVRELLPVVDALAHAHAAGIWHRDVKPSNILLADGSHAYLTDLGLAKDSVDPEVTRTGVFKGSVRYMSPEQARARLRLVDQRSDVFSMGLVLFEALTGEHAFAGEGVEERDLLERIAHGESRFLYEVWPEAPAALSATLYRALRPEREDRYATMQAMAADLRAALDGEPVSVRLPDWKDRLRAGMKRRRVPVAVGGLAVLVCGLVVALVLSGPSEPTVPVVVESTADGHRVLVQDYDPATGHYGPARAFGNTPVRGELPAGAYRITVVATDGAFAEFGCQAKVPSDGSEPEELILRARPSPIGAVKDDMVRIEPGPFVAGHEDPENTGTPYLRRAEEIHRAFWIDRHEVTVGEFVEFTDATGRPRPAILTGLELEDVARLPVARVPWAEAAAYAAWAGKRLPTRLEWERAGRGTDGRIRPWDDSSGDDPAIRDWACVGRDPEFDQSNARWADRACPVGTHPRDRSPDGVYDMAGSVMEFVEEPAALWNDGVVRLNPEARLFMGASWKLPPVALRLDIWGTVPDGPGGQDFGLGFRCARSAAPAEEEGHQN